MTDETTLLPIEDFGEASEVGPLLATLAQQAVLPRKLDHGVYALSDAVGNVRIEETEGARLLREHLWAQERSDRPEFVHRGVTLLDVDSFIDYLSHNTESTQVGPAEVDSAEYAHGSGELELWANLDEREIKAILDGYNARRQHTATLKLKTSREWGEWLAIDGRLLTQVDFSEFIEDHISTIAEPDGGTLLDICQTLQGTTNAVWKQQGILATGQRSWSYKDAVEASAGIKGELKPPTEMILVLRPFQGSDPIAIKARFRFRPNQGSGIQLGVKLDEPQRILETAFAAIVEDVQDRVPVHINLGRG